MSIGSGFPPEFVRERVLRFLRPGAVIKLCRRMDDGEIHEKRFVVVQVGPTSSAFVINSAVSAFVRARPALLAGQISMVVNEHPFMLRDSHVDCSRVRRYATEDVIKDLVERPEWMLGNISPDLRAAIR